MFSLIRYIINVIVVKNVYRMCYKIYINIRCIKSIHVIEALLNIMNK